MRRRVTGGCLLLVAATLALHAGCRSSSTSSGSLTGTVKDALTKTPIDNAEVTIGAAVAYTDDRGVFHMEELGTGERDVSVAAGGYHTLNDTVTIEAGDNTAVLELTRLGTRDGGAQDGPQSDGPVQQDGGQHDAAQQDGPSCYGNSCTYGYAYGQCCVAAQYCTNYAGASSLVCKSNCGAIGDRCGYHSDCCNGNCVSGTCAAPSCAGNSCTYGYAYGECCVEAQYCISSACRATCGATNERCGYHNDCCSNNCVSGYCAEASCAGNTCTYGYYGYGGCCSTAPYCTNSNGYSYSLCRATCGAEYERCYSSYDCCSGVCTSGYCAAASCAGTACTYGYSYGGCCSAQPYCISYYSVAQQTCSATCGAASQHCTYNTDCCSGSCTYNSSAGWNICN